MESLYYVLAWACHRKCRHCYEPRFKPYTRGALERVVAEAEAAMPRILANLPDRLMWRDGDALRPGRIILAGGEVLLDPVRTRVLYPALERIADRWGAQGVRVVVQTTGDLVTPAIVDDLLARGVWTISVAGMDDFHVGLEGEKRLPLIDRLRAMFEAAGMRPGTAATPSGTPVYSFFGATEDAWIGKIWPRGRAWENNLSRATMDDNFCNAWSGGLGFLAPDGAGAEVSIDPNGDVFPCCLKTRAPLGNLVEERLEDILASLRGHPAFEAISAGAPQRMGLAFGWDEARFAAACHTTRPDGAPYANLCIGCDRFHEAVLAPILADLAARRRAARAAA